MVVIVYLDAAFWFEDCLSTVNGSFSGGHLALLTASVLLPCPFARMLRRRHGARVVSRDIRTGRLCSFSHLTSLSSSSVGSFSTLVRKEWPSQKADTVKWKSIGHFICLSLSSHRYTVPAKCCTLQAVLTGMSSIEIAPAVKSELSNGGVVIVLLLLVGVLILLLVSAAVTSQFRTGKSVVKVDEATAAQAATTYQVLNTDYLSMAIYSILRTLCSNCLCFAFLPHHHSVQMGSRLSNCNRIVVQSNSLNKRYFSLFSLTFWWKFISYASWLFKHLDLVVVLASIHLFFCRLWFYTLLVQYKCKHDNQCKSTVVALQPVSSKSLACGQTCDRWQGDRETRIQCSHWMTELRTGKVLVVSAPTVDHCNS